MKLENKCEELENIIDTTELLISEITDKYYIDLLKQISFEAKTKLEEIQEQIKHEQDIELREINYIYERSRI